MQGPLLCAHPKQLRRALLLRVVAFLQEEDRRCMGAERRRRRRRWQWRRWWQRWRPALCFAPTSRIFSTSSSESLEGDGDLNGEPPPGTPSLCGRGEIAPPCLRPSPSPGGRGDFTTPSLRFRMRSSMSSCACFAASFLCWSSASTLSLILLLTCLLFALQPSRALRRLASISMSLSRLRSSYSAACCSMSAPVWNLAIRRLAISFSYAVLVSKLEHTTPWRKHPRPPL